MQQRDYLKEDEVQRLLTAAQVAEDKIAKREAERVQQIAHAYKTGVETAARESRNSPSRSPASSRGSAQFYDMSASDQDRDTDPDESEWGANVFNSFAGAKSSRPPTEAVGTTAGSALDSSVAPRRWPRIFGFGGSVPIIGVSATQTVTQQTLTVTEPQQQETDPQRPIVQRPT